MTDMIKDRPLPYQLTTVTLDRPLSVNQSPAYESVWRQYFRIVDWTVCLTWARTPRNLTPAFFDFWYPCTKTLLPQFWLPCTNQLQDNWPWFKFGALAPNQLPETLNVVLILVPLHQNKTSGNFEFGFNWFGALAPTQTSRNPSWFWIGLVPLHQTKTFWNLLLIKIDLVPLHQPKTSWTRELVKLIWCPCAKSTEPFVSPLHEPVHLG